MYAGVAGKRFSFVDEEWYIAIVEVGLDIMLVVIDVRGDDGDVTVSVFFFFNKF